MGSHILSGLWLDARGGLSIGENSVVNQRCRLDNRGGIMIGKNVSVSPEVHIITAEHDIMAIEEFTGWARPVEIEDHVFIGSKAIILPEVKLGRGAVVAAGAVVTKSVDDYTIVAGVPARKIGERPQVNYKLAYHRHFF